MPGISAQLFSHHHRKPSNNAQTLICSIKTFSINCNTLNNAESFDGTLHNITGPRFVMVLTMVLFCSVPTVQFGRISALILQYVMAMIIMVIVTVMVKINITLLYYYNVFWLWFFPNLGIGKRFKNLRHWMATQTFQTTNTFIEGTIHLTALLDLWDLGTQILYALNEYWITWHWEAAGLNRINLEHKWRQKFDQWSIRQYFSFFCKCATLTTN